MYKRELGCELFSWFLGTHFHWHCWMLPVFHMDNPCHECWGDISGSLSIKWWSSTFLTLKYTTSQTSTKADSCQSSHGYYTPKTIWWRNYSFFGFFFNPESSWVIGVFAYEELRKISFLSWGSSFPSWQKQLVPSTREGEVPEVIILSRVCTLSEVTVPQAALQAGTGGGQGWSIQRYWPQRLRAGVTFL